MIFDFCVAEEPQSRPSCDLFWFCKVNFFSMAENFEVFKFQSQKCFWSKFKSRHGCYNPQRIICNHSKLWISWDAQEIKRFSISFGGDIFFATGGSWSQQLIISKKYSVPKSVSRNCKTACAVYLKVYCDQENDSKLKEWKRWLSTGDVRIKINATFIR